MGYHLSLEGLWGFVGNLKYTCSKRMLADPLVFIIFDEQENSWDPLQRSQQLHRIIQTLRLRRLDNE